MEQKKTLTQRMEEALAIKPKAAEALEHPTIAPLGMRTASGSKGFYKVEFNGKSLAVESKITATSEEFLITLSIEIDGRSEEIVLDVVTNGDKIKGCFAQGQSELWRIIHSSFYDTIAIKCYSKRGSKLVIGPTLARQGNVAFALTRTILHPCFKAMDKHKMEMEQLVRETVETPTT